MPFLPAAARTARAALAALRPAPLPIDAGERWRVIAGSALGVLLAALLSRWAAGGGTPWQFAPLGASALLVFGVPGSPMAQPWAVVAGNTVSALVGVACVHLVPDPVLGGALALAGAVAAMMALRCLHPPGGATALLMVLAQTASPRFAFFPVFCDSLVLVLLGVLYNRATGRAYPHPQRAAAGAAAARASRFTGADIDAALARRNELLDVSRDELESLLEQAEAEAYRRNIGELRCRDVMSPRPHVVHFGTPLLEAWGLMRRHRVKALPVVDRASRVVGIVTTADFIRLANLDQPLGLAARLRAALRPSGTTHAERAEVVGQIMTRHVRVASQDGSVAELIPLFASTGHHHLPIIDGEQRIVGIVTQSDLVRALHRAVRPHA